LELQARAARCEPTFLDQYGATDEAEFFAVATESFFERPLRFQEEHPDLYELLADYSNQDPAARHRRV
jgi:Mlc titration factor MtfA (ptsG expression regulator)